MTKDEALDKALNALLWANIEINDWRDDAQGYTPEDQPQIMDAITAIKQARSAPVQEPVFKPCSCRWKGEEQVQQCTLHAAHIEAIHEWAERAKSAEAKLKEKTNDQ